MRVSSLRPLGGLLAVLFASLALPLAAQEAAAPAAAEKPEKWSIEEPHAPTVPLDFVTEEGTWMSVDVSPDGRTVLFDLLGHLYEVPFEGGEARPLTEGRSWNMFPRYSPDGARILFTSDRSGSDDLWVLERGTDSLRNVTEMELPAYRGTWSRDGTHVYGTVFGQDGKSTGYRFALRGEKQQLVEGGVFQPLGQFTEDAARGRVLFEQNDRRLYASGPRIRSYDLATGELDVYVERPGGGFAPVVSPDGRWLAYVHRDDQETTLVLHDLETRSERTLLRGLDRDRLEYGAYHYGVYPGLAWHPGGREIVLGQGGRLRAVDVQSGAVRDIPFRARVRRDLNRTLRVPVPMPRGEAATLSHRWAQRTDRGILYEALGDLWLKGEDEPRNLTRSPEHETSPVYDPRSRTLYYAAWSDEALGAVYAQRLGSGKRERLTSRPTQYGGLSLSPDGRTLALVRGSRRTEGGQRIEGETDFDLLLLGPDRREREVTGIEWTPNFAAKRPPSVTFAPDGEHLLFSEFEGDSILVVKRVELDGDEETVLYRFPHAVEAVVSPDARWIAFREYHRSYVTPLDYIGKPVTVSAEDGQGYTRRVDEDEDGNYLAWSPDSRTLQWTRGGAFHEKSLDEILEETGDARATDIAVRYAVAEPAGTVALRGVRVVTMDPERRVLENATVLVEGSRIAAVGADVQVPAGAKVYDLAGHTVIPGIVDAHAHYNSEISPLNVVEQRVPGLLAGLAHGVTTMYELYGTTEKDFWLMDMLRAGRLDGPRLLSVGTPIYGMRFFRPKLFRAIDSYEDALEHARYNRDHGATALKDYVLFTREDRHQLATAAREAGINLVSETAGNPVMNLTQVIDGMTGLEHSMGLTPLYDDVVRLLAASEVGITPTLLVVYNGPAGQSLFNQTERVWENEKLLRFTRRDDLLSFRRSTHFWPDDLYSPEMAAEMKKLHEAGVPIQLGAHGQMYGLDAHWEMELFAQGGFEPLQVLEIATLNGARYHGLDADLGSLEPGKLADLVVLEKNPLEDIRNTRAIRYVMKNGVLYAGEDAARVWPEPAPAPPMYFQPER